jgi:DNA-binding beta-propeller fold protein YncE/mono/diheme cytochrome c family protein
MALAACCVLAARAASYLSPECVAVAPDGKTLYVTAATSSKLLLVDAASGKPAGEWPLKVSPSGVAAAADGTVYVTGGGAEGMLYKFSAAGKALGRVEVGHTPLSPVVSADGASVYVLSRFGNAVLKVDAAKMKVADRVAALREPHAAAFGAGGKLLFVANHLPCCKATDDVVSAAVTVIDAATFKVVKQVPLPNGSTGVRGVAASPDGKFIYVTHTFGRYQLPTTQLERGWMNTAGLSVLSGESGDYVNTALLDDVDLGAANPWGVAVTPDGKKLLVAHAGTREISVIDREAFHARLDKAAKNEKVTEVTKSAADVPNDLSFLVTIRTRVKVGADGPRGLAVAGGRAFAACYFADALAEIKLADAALKASLLPLGAAVDLSKDRARRGEMLFNDGSMCFQQWQSCASCHPDGRADGLNWDLVNDGIGNPKQTKNMVYSHLTPPTMVTGIRADMQTCNRKGMTHIQFVVRPEEDAVCIDQYVMALKPVPSPFLSGGSLSKAAKRGEKLFKKAGCAECHPSGKEGPNGERLFTNLKKYDLGLGVGNEEKREFDTSTLAEVWRTAPYLYDGRALTMEELLTTCNPKDSHGATKALSAEEIKSLAEYVLSF